MALVVTDGKNDKTEQNDQEYVYKRTRDGTWVKSKETVGNSWTVLKVILGHKYHHNH